MVWYLSLTGLHHERVAGEGGSEYTSQSPKGTLTGLTGDKEVMKLQAREAAVRNLQILNPQSELVTLVVSGNWESFYF